MAVLMRTGLWQILLLLAWTKHHLNERCLRPNSSFCRVVQDVFRTDAKASSKVVAMGVWEYFNETPAGRARGFALERTRQNAPLDLQEGRALQAHWFARIAGGLCGFDGLWSWLRREGSVAWL